MSSPSLALQPGERLAGFNVTRVREVPLISARFVELSHPAGARWLHVEREDDNLAFSVVLQTLPEDDTGIAHILEHMVLSGSERYPVKSPFFAMTTRSLSTFMNALTGQDTTFYPFSTRSAKDFHNLLAVYLDAVFSPLLSEDTFLREAWRLEHENVSDAASPLKLQGVVYNEMKGAQASPGAVLMRARGAALLPGTVYRHHSGGDPAAIPELTFGALRAFHARHYHPAAAMYYSYGSLDLEPVLGAVAERIAAAPERPHVPVPPRGEPLREDLHQTVAYASSDPQGTQHLLSWVLHDSADQGANLRWETLDELLLGSDAAPLRRALIDSGLGEALADGSGFGAHMPRAVFGVGLKGLRGTGAVPEVEALIRRTLEQAAQGFDAQDIESALHQLELSQREVSNEGWPFGFKVMFQALQHWELGQDPAEAFDLDAQLRELRAAALQGNVFGDMLRELLNTPALHLTLVPDPELGERQLAAERERIAALSAGFGPDEHARVAADAARVLAAQEAEQDHSVLPSLGAEDVPRTVPRPPYRLEETGGARLATAEQPTSGMVYLDAQLAAGAVGNVELLSFFAFALTRSGAGDLDHVALARRIDATTGGLYASAHAQATPDDLGRAELALSFGGRALGRNGAALTELWELLLREPRFEPERLKQLLALRISALKSSVPGMGSAYAARLAAAQLTPAAALGERLSGLSLLPRLLALEPEALPAQFALLLDGLRQGELLALATVPAGGGLPLAGIGAAAGGGAAAVHPPTLPRRPQARTFDLPVNYNAAAFPGVPYAHPDSAPLLVLAHWLSDNHLLPAIREQGGAYGAGASYGPLGGVFTLSSYRDPGLGRTFEVFQNAARALDKLKADTLLPAILSASAQLDPLHSPDTVARSRFFADMAGVSAGRQEALKAAVLATTADDLQRVAATYLRPERAAYATVTGGDPGEATATLGLDFEVRPVMPQP